jgi:hypothetical protein
MGSAAPMPLSDWLRGRRSGPARRVRQALTLSRDGDVTAAVEMIAERFPEALDELRALGEAVDAGWLRLATALEFRSGRMLEGHATAERALAIDEDPQTWHLLGRLRTWLGRADATDAFRRAALMDPAEFFLPYRVTRQQLRQIVEVKRKDLNAYDDAAAMKMIEGSARSMGLTVAE